MLKKSISILLIVLSFYSCDNLPNKNSKEYDTRAISALDSLSSIIGDFKSCSFTLDVAFVKNEEKVINKNDVYLRGPNKIYVSTVGSRGSKGYWYDGTTFSVLNYIKETYDTIYVPGNIISTVDHINKKYGIDFPATDFFYPSFVDDIIGNYDNVYYVGLETINNTSCIGVSASNSSSKLYIWIDKETYLPYKMVIDEIGETENMYESVFSNWVLNPNLPDKLFLFKPMASTKREELILKTDK